MTTQFGNSGSLFEKLATFKSDFERLLPKNPRLLSQYPLYIAIKNKLRQSGEWTTSPEDILYEVYMAGIEAIKRGTSIKNLSGWAYAVALRIIARRISTKSHPKIQFVSYDGVGNDYLPAKSHELDDQETSPNQHGKIQQAMKQLNQRDQELLELCVIQDLSFKEIMDYQAQQGKSVVSEVALRKQKQRALLRLKHLFILDHRSDQ